MVGGSTPDTTSCGEGRRVNNEHVLVNNKYRVAIRPANRATRQSHDLRGYVSGPRFKNLPEQKKEKEKQNLWTIQTAQNFKNSELGALVRKEWGFQIVKGGAGGRRWSGMDRPSLYAYVRRRLAT